MNERPSEYRNMRSNSYGGGLHRSMFGHSANILRNLGMCEYPKELERISLTEYGRMSEQTWKFIGIIIGGEDAKARNQLLVDLSNH
jgi:hypothetical protein